MLIIGDQRFSQLAVCLKAAPMFLLSAERAVGMVSSQIKKILTKWEAICDEARLSTVDRQLFWRRQFLNPFAFEGAPPEIAKLVE